MEIGLQFKYQESLDQIHRYLNLEISFQLVAVAGLEMILDEEYTLVNSCSTVAPSIDVLNSINSKKIYLLLLDLY